MRIGDQLYFAPGIRFSEIDGSGGRLPKQLQARIDGFYLGPAEILAGNGHGFAAGLLCVCAIDALALLRCGQPNVGKRFVSWVRAELPSFDTPELAENLYRSIRNGLVHESRLKDGAEFSLERDQTVSFQTGFLQVNPLCLILEVRAALSRFVVLLEKNEEENKRFRGVLLDCFSFELRGVHVDN